MYTVILKIVSTEILQSMLSQYTKKPMLLSRKAQKNTFGRCDLEMAAILVLLDGKTFKKYNFYSS